MALVDKVEVDALFVINQVVALIFVADMGINFRLPYKEPIKGGASEGPDEIAVKYLSSWFWIDLVSIVPFDIMTVAGVFGPQEAGAGSDVSKLKAVKLIGCSASSSSHGSCARRGSSRASRTSSASRSTRAR